MYSLATYFWESLPSPSAHYCQQLVFLDYMRRQITALQSLNSAEHVQSSLTHHHLLQFQTNAQNLSNSLKKAGL